MPLLNIVIFLIVVGVLLWAVNNYIPMDGKIKQILNIVVVIGVVIWLLDAFGILGRAREVRVGAATQTQSIESELGLHVVTIARTTTGARSGTESR